jgi:hypothetical protein
VTEYLCFYDYEPSFGQGVAGKVTEVQDARGYCQVAGMKGLKQAKTSCFRRPVGGSFEIAKLRISRLDFAKTMVTSPYSASGQPQAVTPAAPDT